MRGVQPDAGMVWEVMSAGPGRNPVRENERSPEDKSFGAGLGRHEAQRLINAGRAKRESFCPGEIAARISRGKSEEGAEFGFPDRISLGWRVGTGLSQ
jgi:hypothetical protein